MSYMDELREETKLSTIFNLLDDNVVPAKIAYYVTLPIDKVEDIIRKIQSGEIERPKD